MRIVRRLTGVTIVTALTAALSLGLGGMAVAAEPGEKVSAKGTSALGPVTFDVKSDEAGRLTGDFQGDVTLGGETTFVHVEGPPTCLTVEGKKAAFVYRVTNEPTAEPQGIYVSMEEGSNGVHHIGFAGPAPIADLRLCPIGPAPLEFHGTMKVTDAS